MDTETDSRGIAEAGAEHAEAGAQLDPERVAFEAAQRQAEEAAEQQAATPISARELVLGLVALLVWFGLFSGGILVGTGPYREALQAPTEIAPTIGSWLVVCAFWTVTNIGVLACVAAFLGAVGRRTRFTSRTDLEQSAPGSRPDLNGVATYYLSAVMRGFGIYTLVLAGLLILATESLASPTQAAYMRLAPTVSIISFYVGYDPSMFAQMLDRVKGFLQTSNQQGK